MSSGTAMRLAPFILYLLGFWVSVEPADDFSDLLELLARSVFEAAVDAVGDVTLLGAFVWAKADPAEDFAASLELELFNTLEAEVAAFFPVTSLFLLMIYILRLNTEFCVKMCEIECLYFASFDA